ncbi:MAG: methionyl-tRNA formyltransferase [Chromatiales bacterium]|jgi:methionyl-tRNA formyltransferase|nr:methionyl-tRNA formyltransferase [Chromatiales bacterium]
MSPLRLAFAGTPELAAVVLEAMVLNDFMPSVVLTQPDRRSGRGRKLSRSPVKEVAQTHDIAIMQPERLKDGEAAAQLASYDLDAMIVAAYGLIVPPQILSLPRYGCLNVHGSLLPRWRGASPIQAAILAGDTHTGVTIMQMDAGLDTGTMLSETTCPIEADDTAESLTAKLATMGAREMVTVLRQLTVAPLAGKTQEATLATYAPRIRKDDAKLDFTRTALELEREVRAYRPWPVSYTSVNGERLRVWAAHADANADLGGMLPGTVVTCDEASIVVATAGGALHLLTVQRAGAKAVSAQAFLRARPIAPGTVIGQS